MGVGEWFNELFKVAGCLIIMIIVAAMVVGMCIAFGVMGLK